MKKILFIVPLLFCVSGYCQTLSVNDLVKIVKERSAKELLISKSFKLDDENTTLQYYYFNKGTAKEERVIFDTKRDGIIYDLPNLNAINSLLKQVKKQFHTIVGDDEKTSGYYQLGDGVLSINVNINKITERGSIDAGYMQ